MPYFGVGGLVVEQNQGLFYISGLRTVFPRGQQLRKLASNKFVLCQFDYTTFGSKIQKYGLLFFHVLDNNWLLVSESSGLKETDLVSPEGHLDSFPHIPDHDSDDLALLVVGVVLVVEGFLLDLIDDPDDVHILTFYVLVLVLPVVVLLAELGSDLFVGDLVNFVVLVLDPDLGRILLHLVAQLQSLHVVAFALLKQLLLLHGDPPRQVHPHQVPLSVDQPQVEQCDGPVLGVLGVGPHAHQSADEKALAAFHKLFPGHGQVCISVCLQVAGAAIATVDAVGVARASRDGGWGFVNFRLFFFGILTVVLPLAF